MSKKVIAIVVLLIAAYLVNSYVFFPGHKYIGEWVSDKEHVRISKDGKDFILVWNPNSPDKEIMRARFNEAEGLLLSTGAKIRVIAEYLPADDALASYGSYFKRK